MIICEICERDKSSIGYIPKKDLLDNSKWEINTNSDFCGYTEKGKKTEGWCNIFDKSILDEKERDRKIRFIHKSCYEKLK